jgi:AbrB family looped-hinge helix DNA binding protein
MIITIPKKIVEAMELKKGEDLRIYTDGEKIYIDRFELESSI